LGFVAGAVGAQLAGVLAYGGWAIPDWIMNFLAGGLANAMVPAFLFRYFKVDPALGSGSIKTGTAVTILLIIIFGILALAVLLWQVGNAIGLELGKWAFVPAIILLLAVPFVLSSVSLDARNFVVAIAIVIVSCFISAAIGVWGSVVAGQTWTAAILATGIGWFLGDTASGILGLYVLSYMTRWAQQLGIAPSLTIAT
jgi:hypothetical protein